MQKRKTNLIAGCLSALLLTTAVPVSADSYAAGGNQDRVAVMLIITHPVRIQVQADLICLYNHAERSFSIRQTQGTRAFDHNDSMPSRYRTLDSDECKNGQALQLDAEPDRTQEQALLHVLVEPD